MRSEKIPKFKIMFLQLIVLSLKVYQPTATATSILSFTVHYLQLMDPLTMSVVYLYKNKTSEEKQIIIQTATWGIPEWPGLPHFPLAITGVRAEGLSYSSSHFRKSFTMWIKMSSCKTPLFTIGLKFFSHFTWNVDNLTNNDSIQWSSELLV